MRRLGGTVEQITYNYRSGKVTRLTVPPPLPGSGRVLVQTRASLASIGTEAGLLEFARKNLLSKALSRKDLTRQVIEKAKTEGIIEAWRQALGRLSTAVPLGYSSAGLVTEVGAGVTKFTVGDRVACSGAGYAGHVQIASVPASLCVHLPDNVDFSAGSFVATGGIALEAVRMAQVSLGESVAVIGLGLLGLLTTQLLRAAGCTVAGMDTDSAKAEMALRLGAHATTSDYTQLAEIVASQTSGHGVDAVIITASTPSNEPLEQAAQLARERGRIVATGLVGLEIPRKPVYEKELEIVVSRGWGPGLDDPGYRDKGLDYPVGYARWTAERNLQAFLQQVSLGTVDVESLVTHRYPLEQTPEAYEMILEGSETAIGVLITYPDDPVAATPRERVPGVHAPNGRVTPKQGTVGVGVVGAGLFARGTMLPAMRRLKGLHFRGIASSTGLLGRQAADDFGFDYCTSDYQELLSDDAVHALFILTRHDSHAGLAADALRAGKHVFVEKPLAMNEAQLDEVMAALADGDGRLLMVGFNRRFSPFSRWLRGHLAALAAPLAVHLTVNAGTVGQDSWVLDPEVGGGRIIGELCHFVDLTQYLSGSLPVRVWAEPLTSPASERRDDLMVTLKMADGGIGSIAYLSGGDKGYPRERVEVFGGGAIGVIENFKAASFISHGKTKRAPSKRTVDRGHTGELEAFFTAIREGGSAPVAQQEYIATTLATFAIERSLAAGAPVELATDS